MVSMIEKKSLGDKRGGCVCVNEKGWGLVVGECSMGISGKAGIPQGSHRQRPQGQCGEFENNAWLCQCHGDASLNYSNGVRGMRGLYRDELNLKEPSISTRFSQANQQAIM